MSCRRYRVYLAWNAEEYRLEMSHDPLLDLRYLHSTRGYREMVLLTQALPIGEAAYLLDRLATAGEKSGQPFDRQPCDVRLLDVRSIFRRVAWWKRNTWRGPAAVVRAKLRQADKEARRMGVPGRECGTTVNLADTGAVLLPGAGELAAIREVLAGRLLYLSELQLALEGRGRPANSLECALQVLHLQGECVRMPSLIYRGPGRWQCLRCGETRQVQAADCLGYGSRRCACCVSCAMMGESRLCRPIYAMPGRGDAGQPEQPDRPVAVQVRLDFALTPAQKDAAAAVRRFLRREGREECLVWAACGAGKTELAVEAVAEVLRQGRRVLFAIPRRDVVMELAPRLQAALPGIRVHAVYGGSREKFRSADLVVATTHQAIRLYRQFPLVVLDEVDAFPYRGSEMLHYAVNRARVPGGRVLYLTATPQKELFNRARRGEVELVYLPARHHGYPLPEPRLLMQPSLRQHHGRSQVTEVVLDFLRQSVEEDLAQVFVFVPSVYLALRVGEALRQATGFASFNRSTKDWVFSSHSRDPEREQKRERFCRGEFPVFVTTTIMERGITVPRVNVLVLFAEQEGIFDEGTLVQMAGRAGRTVEYPGGRVWFVGARWTTSMTAAVDKIQLLNQEAWRRGYLRTEYYPDQSNRKKV